jgi:hypothetical protein
VLEYQSADRVSVLIFMGKALRTAEGIVAAEPMPCSARMTFRAIELGAKPLPIAQASDQSVPSKKAFLRPKRSASRPNNSKKHP